MGDDTPLWNLWTNKAVPKEFRRALEFTFDRWVCPPALLKELADACEYVGKEIAEANPNHVNHWPQFAVDLRTEQARKDARLLGIGLGCTSVCNPWEEWRPGEDDIYFMEPAPEN
jgi:hypothetical protein